MAKLNFVPIWVEQKLLRMAARCKVAKSTGPFLEMRETCLIRQTDDKTDFFSTLLPPGCQSFGTQKGFFWYLRLALGTYTQATILTNLDLRSLSRFLSIFEKCLSHIAQHVRFSLFGHPDTASPLVSHLCVCFAVLCLERKRRTIYSLQAGVFARRLPKAGPALQGCSVRQFPMVISDNSFAG